MSYMSARIIRPRHEIMGMGNLYRTTARWGEKMRNDNRRYPHGLLRFGLLMRHSIAQSEQASTSNRQSIPIKAKLHQAALGKRDAA